MQLVRELLMVLVRTSGVELCFGYTFAMYLSQSIYRASKAADAGMRQLVGSLTVSSSFKAMGVQKEANNFQLQGVKFPKPQHLN